ncbi:MAG: Rrf2 family transcriptional regulator [Candidatus Sericytochromatia bacterium]|nr:Rrf2 family transcriptional regulator [Candidatus Sericytochromatia bacterium]
MKNDNRLWRMLHVLIHMSHTQKPMTSQAIGEMLNTNSVVVRRTMAGLRDRNYVQSEKGHGGGWRLICPLEEITLLDIYLALGSPAIFAIGAASDTHHCLVEKAVNQAIDDVLEQAKQLLLARFGQIKLSQIQNDFQVLREVTVDCREQLNPD